MQNRSQRYSRRIEKRSFHKFNRQERKKAIPELVSDALWELHQMPWEADQDELFFAELVARDYYTLAEAELC